MAKTAPLKKQAAATLRVHSRAAKRASSPSIDTDKSLKDVHPPVQTQNQRPSILAIHQGAGISKKSKNGRKSVLSSKARRRQQKGLDRAAADIDKKEKRMQQSKGKAKAIQERSKTWDDVNKSVIALSGDGTTVAVSDKDNVVESPPAGINMSMEDALT